MTRLMCSKDRKEVEAVRSELFRNGIRSEIRSNPVAEALRVSRVELWLQDECDYFKASKLYGAIQERGTGDTPKTPVRESHPTPEAEVYIEAEELTPPKVARSRAKSPVAAASEVVVGPPPTADAVPTDGSLVEVSGLLEKEIEELLARDAELNARCSSLERTADGLKESLGAAETRLEAESSARVAAEKKASDMAEWQTSLQSKLTEQAAAKEQLARTVTALRDEVKLREQAAAAASAKAESRAHELKEQQTLVVALRNELGAREQNLRELGETLARAGIDLNTEKQARAAAEERLSECAVARTALEQQVAQQTQQLQKVTAELQARDAQMQAYLGRLNALRGKLHGRT